MKHLNGKSVYKGVALGKVLVLKRGLCCKTGENRKSG